MKHAEVKISKGVLLQQDNARVHTCKVAMDAVEQNGHKSIPHPDLASSDICLFSILKTDIRGCHFWSDDVVTTVEEWVNGKDPYLFQFWVDGT